MNLKEKREQKLIKKQAKAEAKRLRKEEKRLNKKSALKTRLQLAQVEIAINKTEIEAQDENIKELKEQVEEQATEITNKVNEINSINERNIKAVNALETEKQGLIDKYTNQLENMGREYAEFRQQTETKDKEQLEKLNELVESYNKLVAIYKSKEQENEALIKEVSERNFIIETQQEMIKRRDVAANVGKRIMNSAVQSASEQYQKILTEEQNAKNSVNGDK